jgi:hypothetical protein
MFLVSDLLVRVIAATVRAEGTLSTESRISDLSRAHLTIVTGGHPPTHVGGYKPGGGLMESRGLYGG